MDKMDDMFDPRMFEAFKKLDPEDGERIADFFQTHALLTREKRMLQTSVRDQKKLLVENGKLKKDIEQLRVQLKDKQRRRIAKAMFSPAVGPASEQTTAVNQSPSDHSEPSASAVTQTHSHRRRRGEHKARPLSAPLSLDINRRVDVSRLELRVGRIISVRRHPLVDGLTVQEVDLGEGQPRSCVSKTEAITEPWELQGSLAVLLCNVKACRLKGVMSEARLLVCCSTNDVTELLTPPPSAEPGDRVTFLNFPGESDRELQAKQHVWELVEPDLSVDSRGVANYKGCGFEVKGKGLCRAPTLTNCSIK